MRPSVPATASPRRQPGAPGSGLVVVGLLLAALAVVTTVRVTYPTGLGIMLGLVLLYMIALSLLLVGVARRRAGTDAADAGTPTMLCLVLDHRFDRVPVSTDAPEHWRCRRCGKRRYTEPLSAGETLNATRVDRTWIRRGDEP